MLLQSAILVLHNYINACIDARRIKAHKRIYHGVNAGAYMLVVSLLIWWVFPSVFDIILFAISAFVNRQITFDIPLNLKRGLPWDYVTRAVPPSSYMDRVEIKLFGRDGQKVALIYLCIWILTIFYQISS